MARLCNTQITVCCASGCTLQTAPRQRAFAERFREDQSNPEWDNTPLMKQILKLAAKRRICWDFPIFRVSLATKMASTRNKCKTFG